MGETAVDVQQVSKRFRLGHEKYNSTKERIIHRRRSTHEDLWALRDVAFEVKEGETVGILGRNGSGKSTLLKCICGVLQPTEGQVVVRGKLAGLLELGAGFQQELSGRDNVYMNGAMLGLSTKEVDRLFDDIVEFAELERFIDTQVKFYSSGMYVRLGFAVAVNVDPDILVIDEVLAVGDERFQVKCIERIKSFQDEGRTILFVSHSPDQVRAICDRGVVLSNGKLIGSGPPGEAVRIFREELLEAGSVLGVGEETTTSVRAGAMDGVPVRTRSADGRHPVRLTGVSVEYPGDRATSSYLTSGDPLTVRLDYDVHGEVPNPIFVMEMRDNKDNLLLRIDTESAGIDAGLLAEAGSLKITIDSFPFADGVYWVNGGVRTRDGGGQPFDWGDPACKFEVMSPGRSTGMVELPLWFEFPGRPAVPWGGARRRRAAETGGDDT